MELQFTNLSATMTIGILGIVVPRHVENAKLEKPVIGYPVSWLMFYTGIGKLWPWTKSSLLLVFFFMAYMQRMDKQAGS